MGEELAVSCSHSEDSDLSRSVQLMDAVLFLFRPDVQTLAPCLLEAVSQNCFCLTKRQWVGWLLLSAACLGQAIRLFVAPYATVGRDPLQHNICSLAEQTQFLLDVYQDLLTFGRLEALKDGLAVSQENCIGGEWVFLVESLGCE